MKEPVLPGPSRTAIESMLRGNLRALAHNDHIYADTTPDSKVADRRRQNKAAKKARRIARNR